MEQRCARLMLACVSFIAAYEFLVSGLDKIVSGRFPAGLGATLLEGASENPNHWYIGFLRAVVTPHAAVWGYAIEWGELLIGLALLAAVARWLLWPLDLPAGRERRLAWALTLAGAAAALVGAFMTLNFHLWMGAAPVIGVNPANPFDEGVDLDLLLTLALLVYALVSALTVEPVRQFSADQLAALRGLTARLQTRIQERAAEARAVLAER